jgi:hypothetical protein
MTQHLGMPIPSPAVMEKISTRFDRAVESFAEANGIAWVRFGKDDRKAEVMARYLHLRRSAAPHRSRRSGWRRSSSGCGPPTSGTRPRGTAAHLHQGRPAGDLLLLPVG